MKRRSGLTLTEVLVTLFVLAFGIMAIMTLFPLAASQMFIAVREDRTAQAEHASDALYRGYWKNEVVERNRDNPPVVEDFFAALDAPDTPVPGAIGQVPRGLPAASSTDPASYPVIIDPMGWQARAGQAGQFWFGDAAGTNIPRRSIRLVTTNAAANQYSQRLCSLMDGFGYNDLGVPTQDREMRYNWLWVIQRVPNNNKFASTLTVVVFDFRPHLSSQAGAEAVFTNVPLVPGTTSIDLPGSPNVKPGQWIMDATIAPAGRPLVRQAQFYQIVSATPNGGNTTLELQTPLRVPTDNSTAAYNATIVHLPGVSGVSVRSPLTSE